MNSSTANIYIFSAVCKGCLQRISTYTVHIHLQCLQRISTYSVHVNCTVCRGFLYTLLYFLYCLQRIFINGTYIYICSTICRGYIYRVYLHSTCRRILYIDLIISNICSTVCTVYPVYITRRMHTYTECILVVLSGCFNKTATAGWFEGSEFCHQMGENLSNP